MVKLFTQKFHFWTFNLGKIVTYDEPQNQGKMLEIIEATSNADWVGKSWHHLATGS